MCFEFQSMRKRRSTPRKERRRKKTMRQKGWRRLSRLQDRKNQSNLRCKEMRFLSVTCFWAAAPKGTMSCRTQGDFRSSVRAFVRSFVRPPQALSGLKSALSGLKSTLSGLKSALSGLKSALSGLKSTFSGPKSALPGLKLAPLLPEI